MDLKKGNLRVIQYQDSIRNHITYRLCSGTWNQKNNEIMLSSNARKIYKVGDTVSFQYQQKQDGSGNEKEFVVTGFFDSDSVICNVKTFSRKDTPKLSVEDFTNCVNQQYYGIVSNAFSNSEILPNVMYLANPKDNYKKQDLIEYLEKSWGKNAIVADFGTIEKSDMKFKTTCFIASFGCFNVIFLTALTCLIMIRRKKHYSVFYMSGASYKQLVRYMTTKYYLLLLISFRLAIYAVKYSLKYSSYTYSSCKCASSKIQSEAMKALAFVELQDFSNREVWTMTDGEKMRVKLARAFVNHPKLIVGENVIKGLNHYQARKVMECVERLPENGIASILFMEDEEIGKSCDRLYILKDGILEEI